MGRISPKASVRCTSAACGWRGRRATSRTNTITFEFESLGGSPYRRTARRTVPVDIGYPCPRCGATVAVAGKDGAR